MTDRIKRSKDEEDARLKSIMSYRKLIDHMFQNVLNDTGVALEASSAFVETAKICEEEQDVETGKNLVYMLQTLHDFAEIIKTKYLEQFDGAVITKEDWLKLDEVMERD